MPQVIVPASSSVGIERKKVLVEKIRESIHKRLLFKRRN
jgi:hypothetical protein